MFNMTSIKHLSNICSYNVRFSLHGYHTVAGYTRRYYHNIYCNILIIIFLMDHTQKNHCDSIVKLLNFLKHNVLNYCLIVLCFKVLNLFRISNLKGHILRNI